MSCLASRAMGKRIASRRSIRGDFCPGDRASGTGQARVAPLIRPAFADLHPVLVQPLKAEPRSWPGRVTPSLPDAQENVPPTRADAASCSASKAPSRSAPHEQDMPNIREVWSAGIRIPITKYYYPPSFRGASAASEPGIQISAVMDSGSAPKGASRNDETGNHPRARGEHIRTSPRIALRSSELRLLTAFADTQRLLNALTFLDLVDIGRRFRR